MKRPFLIALGAVAAAACAPQSAGPSRVKGPDVYNLSKGAAVAITAKKADLPLVIFGESGKSGTYVPSGYMGDSGSLKLLSSDNSAPLADGKKGQAALKVKYTSKGPAGWAGVYWLSPANNWAKIKGAGYDLTQSPKLTFWAKGEKGGERIAEVKIGGILGPYPDTDEAASKSLKLTSEWSQYEIDLTGKDMRHIVGGFMFVLRRADNPRGATFLLDEIRFEAPAGAVASAPDDETPAVESGPATVAEKLINEGEGQLRRDLKVVVPFENPKEATGAQLDSLMAEWLETARRHQWARILVEGHTDNVGPEDVNLRLSLERAKAVADYLSRKGIEADRIAVKGYGPDRPVTPSSNETPEGRSKNRRVEVTLVSK